MIFVFCPDLGKEHPWIQKLEQKHPPLFWVTQLHEAVEGLQRFQKEVKGALITCSSAGQQWIQYARSGVFTHFFPIWVVGTAEQRVPYQQEEQKRRTPWTQGFLEWPGEEDSQWEKLATQWEEKVVEEAKEYSYENPVKVELDFELKKSKDRIHALEEEKKRQQQEIEQFKERVRLDLQKIRLHEQELEFRLEVMKRDSEVLLLAREQRLIELKRKYDQLEFQMDLLQQQYDQEKEKTTVLREKLAKASQVVKVAEGLLLGEVSPRFEETRE